ncbi:homoserine O-acetyltransferase MetX [Guptibacillus algicola]|uniref:homoserine O-acetyltransferase MetX n=1 Tax=Guptibacillus algicola TaxID=225844 RepID=UPI001CD38FC6|nr:homoserine O-acetyltransferase [Alkalihalobacillus algicola]MCA0986690.1 homoserine O-acetyltransferase [Alkalihalobacillus algicola]
MERETNYEDQRVSIGSFVLESGKVLEEVELAYERVGPKEAPVILVCHALTGNQYTVGRSEDGWWEGLIGHRKFVDTSEFQVITFNVLGGCNGSTGPLSLDPSRNRPYQADFPFVSVRDMVHSQKRALEALGIDRLHAVIGGSLGGMQVLEWGILYPDIMEHLVPLAVTPSLSAYGIAYNAISRHAITKDPEWRGGYYDHAHPPAAGLATARMIGMISYRTDEMFQKKFGRKVIGKPEDQHTEAAYDVESYLKYQGQKLVGRFDANSYLYLLKAMDHHDITRGRDGTSPIKKIKANVLAISFKGDLIYPPKDLENVFNLESMAQFYIVDTKYGHDGFLVEFEKWGPLIKERLKEPSKI